MFWLITYVLIALVFSFLCSIAEAVLLSVTNAHIALLEKEGKAAGTLLRKQKDDINKPLAAILTLNTIAHTLGAAGAGAQATAVFGSAYLGIASAVLTLLILVFSEIIPKTLGAHYWRALAPITAYALRFLVILLYPFVKLSEALTGGLVAEPTLKGFSRSEFAAMAEISGQEGQLNEQESRLLTNMLLLEDAQVRDVMTPRTVVFSLPENLGVEDFFSEYDNERFSRIPLYQADESDHISGFVLRVDLLLAKARGEGEESLSKYARPIEVVFPSMPLSQAFEAFMRSKDHIKLVVDEYGVMAGIITLEDLFETLLGLEIVDESDKATDMQKLARRLWRNRAARHGLQVSHDEEEAKPLEQEKTDP